MKSNRFVLCLVCIAMLTACQPGASQPSISSDDSKPEDTKTADSDGASEKGAGTSNASDVVFADQGWAQKDRTWFYDTGQGSQLIQYTWILALEQPDNEALFLADDHMDHLRFITRGFEPMQPDRAAHLPVGIVKDGDHNWLGFTCAAVCKRAMEPSLWRPPHE